MKRKSSSPGFDIKIACHTSALDIVKGELFKGGYEVTPKKIFGHNVQLIVKVRKSA